MFLMTFLYTIPNISNLYIYTYINVYIAKNTIMIKIVSSKI